MLGMEIDSASGNCCHVQFDDGRNDRKVLINRVYLQSTASPLLAPFNRVYAPCKRDFNQFWPGFVVATSGKTCQVQFDDGAFDGLVPTDKVLARPEEVDIEDYSGQG